MSYETALFDAATFSVKNNKSNVIYTIYLTRKMNFFFVILHTFKKANQVEGMKTHYTVHSKQAFSLLHRVSFLGSSHESKKLNPHVTLLNQANTHTHTYIYNKYILLSHAAIYRTIFRCYLYTLPPPSFP